MSFSFDIIYKIDLNAPFSETELKKQSKSFENVLETIQLDIDF